MKEVAFYKRMFWAALGAVVSQLAAPHIEDAANVSYDYWCGGGEALTQGKATLRKGILQDNPNLFREAKAELEKSRACKKSEASFLLGVMLCNGMGEPRNRARGLLLIREATAAQPQWAMEILANPDLCPRVNEEARVQRLP